MICCMVNPKYYIMVIKSIYKSMSDDSLTIPDGVNVKMVFRHSFRDTLQGKENPDIVPLNEEGKRAAIEFGMGLDPEIGQMHSSFAPRCIQTLEYINTGKKSSVPIVVSKEILGEGFTMNKKLADQSFKLEGSLKGVAYSLVNEIAVSGFYPIRRTTKSMLDYIFKTGNDVNKLDLYCTHDFHIALMISLIFNLNEQTVIVSQWPRMLEGFFAWGTREDFQIIWRGQYRHLENFLVH